MNASLTQKLQEVEWGEFRLGDLFEIASSKKIYHANQLENIYSSQKDNLFPYVVRKTSDNGIRGYINEPKEYLNEGNTLSFAQDTFTVYYQKEPYFTGNKVKVLKPKFKNNTEKVLLFFESVFNKTLTKSTWGQGSTVNSISSTRIYIPIQNKQIDFNFMESFIAELEAERIAELSAYLKVSGLDNYELSVEELKALQNYDSMEWREYRIGSLFSRISTKKLPYKAKDLPTEVIAGYELPCLTSSFRNQGLNYYVPREGTTILKNVISIPSNSDVYRAYFQSREFTVLSDAYAIKWIDEEKEISNYHYLFMVRAINKVTDLPIYSYKMKLGGWNVVKDKMILLPVVDDEVAFDFMEDYTRAISKLAIKDVIQYTDKRIEATKTVVAEHQKEESE
ncbi:restriction endonuclease [Streptococcus iniae]|nr:restriction endonuclease subunit S [Streptococcus iniae]RLV27090.1 restriction endonuclease [Streptococcus iniae]